MTYIEHYPLIVDENTPIGDNRESPGLELENHD